MWPSRIPCQLSFLVFDAEGIYLHSSGLIPCHHLHPSRDSRGRQKTWGPSISSFWSFSAVLPILCFPKIRDSAKATGGSSLDLALSSPERTSPCRERAGAIVTAPAFPSAWNGRGSLFLNTDSGRSPQFPEETSTPALPIPRPQARSISFDVSKACS